MRQAIICGILRRMGPYQEPVTAIVRDAVEIIQTYQIKREMSCEELAFAAVIAGAPPCTLEGGRRLRETLNPLILRVLLD